MRLVHIRMSTNGRQILLVRQVQDHCKYIRAGDQARAHLHGVGRKFQGAGGNLGRLLHLRAPKAPNLVTAGALQLLGTLFITGGTTHLRSV